MLIVRFPPHSNSNFQYCAFLLLIIKKWWSQQCMFLVNNIPTELHTEVQQPSMHWVFHELFCIHQAHTLVWVYLHKAHCNLLSATLIPFQWTFRFLEHITRWAVTSSTFSNHSTPEDKKQLLVLWSNLTHDDGAEHLCCTPATIDLVVFPLYPSCAVLAKNDFKNSTSKSLAQSLHSSKICCFVCTES